MCFLRARAGSSSSTASRRPDRMLVPPLARDARDVAQDALPVGGALQAHDRAGAALSNTITAIWSAGGSASAVARAASLVSSILGPAIEPDRSMTSASASVASSRALGDVEADGQHRLEARRHVAAGAEALRAARDQQPAALAHEAVQRGQRRLGQQRRAARRRARPDRSGRSRRRAAGRARRARRRRCARRPSARANEPDAPGVAFEAEDARIALGRDRQHALVVLGVAVAAGRGRADVQRRGARLGDAHRERRGRRAGRERDRLLRLVDRDVRVAGAVEADARLGRRDRRAGGRRRGTACARGRRRARSGRRRRRRRARRRAGRSA